MDEKEETGSIRLENEQSFQTITRMRRKVEVAVSELLGIVEERIHTAIYSHS